MDLVSRQKFFPCRPPLPLSFFRIDSRMWVRMDLVEKEVSMRNPTPVIPCRLPFLFKDPGTFCVLPVEFYIISQYGYDSVAGTVQQRYPSACPLIVPPPFLRGNFAMLFSFTGEIAFTLFIPVFGVLFLVAFLRRLIPLIGDLSFRVLSLPSARGSGVFVPGPRNYWPL